MLLGLRKRRLGFALFAALLVLLPSASVAQGQVAPTPTTDDALAATPTAQAPPAPVVEAAEDAPPRVEAPTHEAPVVEAPKDPAPAVEAPKRAAPVVDAAADADAALPKVEAPKVEAPNVSAPAPEVPKAGSDVPLPTPLTEAVQHATATPDRLGSVVDTTAGKVADRQQREGLVRETVATVARGAAAAVPRGATAGERAQTGVAPANGPAAPGPPSPSALDSRSETPIASTSGVGRPPAALAVAPEWPGFASLAAALQGLDGLLTAKDIDHTPASGPPSAPERGPEPLESPALTATGGQGLAFTALLAILSLSIFAPRPRGRVLAIPSALVGARGFHSVIELPG